MSEVVSEPVGECGEFVAMDGVASGESCLWFVDERDVRERVQVEESAVD